MATEYTSDGFFIRNQKYRCLKNPENHTNNSFKEGELYIYESTAHERYDDIFLIRFFPEKYQGECNKALIFYVDDLNDKEEIGKYFEIN